MKLAPTIKNRIVVYLLGSFLLIAPGVRAQRHVTTYHLTIREQRVNKSGKWVRGITVNDSIPAPTLYFTEGDSAVIYIKNELGEESSIHWHGILIPNQYDGVPYLTTPPIEPGKTYTVRFPVRQHGTYWYHSHSMMQEQRGLYGSIVIYPKTQTRPYDHEVVLLLSDWTDENPHRVMKNLKRNSDWYAIKKGQAQSLNRVIGHHGLRERIQMAWQRMPPMDISDVYYNAFLVDGKRELSFPEFRPGERVRLRVIDGSSSTFFHLQFAGSPLEMIAADGQDIRPVHVDRVLMGIAETYDFILTVPDSGAYELRATAQDGTGYASVFFGKGARQAAPELPKPDLFHMMAIQMDGMQGMSMPGMKISDRTMKRELPFVEKAYIDREDANISGGMHGMMNNVEMKPGEMKEMKGMHPETHPDTAHDMPGMKMDDAQTMSHDMPGMQMDKEGLGSDKKKEVIFNYNMLRALHPTDFDTLAHPVRSLTFHLTGSMWRYNWSINGKTLSEDDSIQVKEGEILRINLDNQTMMYHPMHLHGHFFRVLNASGAYAPLKHTVIVPPMRSVTIEFLANEPGDWFFHCHVLYHMMAGMSRIFRYTGYQRPANMSAYPMHEIFHDDLQWFSWGELGLSTDHADGNVSYSNRRNMIRMDGNYGWSEGLNEISGSYEYFFTKYLRPYVGVVSSNKTEYLKYFTNHHKNLPDQDTRAVVGLRYLLPFFLDAEARMDSRGHVRLGLSGETWLWPRLWLHYGVNTDQEFDVHLEGMISQSVSLSAGYDSDYKWGGGVMLRF